MANLRPVVKWASVVASINVIVIFVFLRYGHVKLQKEEAGKLTFSRVVEIKQKTEDVNKQLHLKGGHVICSDCDSNPNKTLYRRKHYSYFSGKYSLDQPPVSLWVTKENTQIFCDGKVTLYGKTFAILHDATMFPKRRINIDKQAKGGEEIKDVLNQGLDKENFVFHNDFLEVSCSSDFPTQNFGLLNSLKRKDSVSRSETYNTDGKYVIALRREDYANLHNWIRNIYNTFLVMIHFQIQPGNLTVIFMDGHPKTELDRAWTVIYGPPLRVGHLESSQYCSNLIDGIAESGGPVSDYLNERVPFLEEFRSFILSQFNLPDTAMLNCKKLRITIIIRRNAIYHPRNIQGSVGRKIFNEAILVDDLNTEFPSACIKPVLMESLPMRGQLEIVSQSDVLIGMHGAGMSHMMFLPKHAAVLEMFSKDFKLNRPWYQCYRSIARWRGLKYDSWENFDPSLEMPFDFTILPTEIIVSKVRLLVDLLCPTLR